MGGTSDKAVFDGLISALSMKLDVYDEILSKQKYLAGNVSVFSPPLRFYFADRAIGDLPR